MRRTGHLAIYANAARFDPPLKARTAIFRHTLVDERVESLAIVLGFRPQRDAHSDIPYSRVCDRWSRTQTIRLFVRGIVPVSAGGQAVPHSHPLGGRRLRFGRCGANPAREDALSRLLVR